MTLPQYRFALPIAAALLALLPACSSSSHGSSSPPAPVAVAAGPATALKLDFKTAAMQAAPLNPDQKSELKSLAREHDTTVPNPDLYFDQYTNTGDKQKDMAKLNDAGRASLKSVLANCEIDPGEEQDDGDYGVGKSHTNAVEKTVSGDDCPINYEFTSKTVSSTKAFDAPTNTFTGSIHTESSETNTNLDQRFLKRTGIANTTSSTSTDTDLENYHSDYAAKALAGSAYLTGTTNTVMTTDDKHTISMVAKIEMLTVPGHKYFQALMTYTLPSGGQVVIAMMKNDDQTTLFVNGETYTPERFRDEFGADLGINI